MKIIILGAGRVGATLASHLAEDENDITLIDLDPEQLQVIKERHDVRTLIGHGSYPQTLESAGIKDADMLVAVTNCDEINMLACHLASKLYHTPTKIARIRAGEYAQGEGLFQPEILDVSLVISPEQLVSRSITQVIEYPGTLQVLELAEGRVLLVVVRAEAGASLVGRPLKTISKFLTETTPKVIAIYRKGVDIPISKDTIIEHGDEVFILTPSFLSREIISLLQTNNRPYKRIIICGGGHIGSELAATLENKMSVKLVDHNPDRLHLVANKLQHTVVLQGDAADKNLLLDENIEDTDIFCAVTNDDEANIMASLLAKKLGVRKVMALVNKSSYVELIEGSDIDVVISPEQATVSGFLRHIRKGDIAQVHTLRRGAAEVIEIIAHGNAKSSKVVGRSTGEINLPKSVTIGAIIRQNKVLMAHEDMLIEEDDHLIVFLRDATKIHAVERLFQVELSFF